MENEIKKPRKTKRKNGSIKPVSDKTIETYSSALFHLKKYLEKRKQKDIAIKELGYRWFDQFEDYLIDDGKATNTISKHKSILKRMLNFAIKDGLLVDATFKDVRCYNEDSIALYLNDTELEQLGNLKLEGSQKAVRDVFLFCCLTGCRWKDALQLNRDNFKQNMSRWFINYRQNKTGNEVYCPVFYQKALDLIEENDYSFVGFHNCHTNKTIRKILLDNNLLQDEIEVVHSCKKYAAKTFKRAEIVTFHTSRRSFCTNLFLKGISLSMIKMGSGHKSDSSLLMYLKQDKKTEAEMIMKAEMASLQRLEMFAA
jgi:site-specific recombinase XerD